MARRLVVRQEFFYAAPPARVFRALTEPKELARWFADRAVVTLAPGGPFELTWSAGYTMAGRVRSVVPGKRLDVRWIDRFSKTRVYETGAHFRLRKKGRGTVLSLTHDGFRSGPEWAWLYGAVHSGWAYYLLNLRSVLEHRTDLRKRDDALG